jgi:hypothetical protein
MLKGSFIACYDFFLSAHCTHTSTCSYTCTHMLICTHTCKYAHIHVHTCIYMHIHAQTFILSRALVFFLIMHCTHTSTCPLTQHMHAHTDMNTFTNNLTESWHRKFKILCLRTNVTRVIPTMHQRYTKSTATRRAHCFVQIDVQTKILVRTAFNVHACMHMWIFLHVCMRTWISACFLACMYVYVNSCAGKCMYVCVRSLCELICMHVCVREFMRVDLHACMRSWIYARWFACMYAYVNLCACICICISICR